MRLLFAALGQLALAAFLLLSAAEPGRAAQPAPGRPPRLPRALTRPTAAADTALAPALPADSAFLPPLRAFDQTRLRELRAQRAFQYEEGQPEEGSLLARLLHWLGELLGRLLDPLLATRNGHLASRTIYYGILVALLVFAVAKLLQVDLTRLFRRTPQALPLGYEVGAEDIHALDFDVALAAAEAAGNLRLAVRLGYLRLLKQLSDAQLIDWQPDKTNQTYLREVAARRPALLPALREATRQFEYVWYGELALTPPLYAAVRDAQRQLTREFVNG